MKGMVDISSIDGGVQSMAALSAEVARLEGMEVFKPTYLNDGSVELLAHDNDEGVYIPSLNILQALGLAMKHGLVLDLRNGSVKVSVDGRLGAIVKFEKKPDWQQHARALCAAVCVARKLYVAPMKGGN